MKTEKEILEIDSNSYYKKRRKELEGLGYKFDEWMPIISKEMDKYIFADSVDNRINEYDFIIKDNVIKVNPEKLFSFRVDKEDSVYIKGNRYSRRINGYEVKKYKDVTKREVNIAFDLIGLNYKFIAPSFFNLSCCLGRVSQNDWANTYYMLHNKNILDKRIKGVHFGKGYKKYSNHFNDYSKEWNQIFGCTLDKNDYGEVDILIDSYGWSNNLWYSLNVIDVLKISHENIKKHSPDLIDLFNYINVDFNKSFDVNLNTLKEVKKEYINAYKEKEKNQSFYIDTSFYKKTKQKTYIMKDDNTGFYKIGKSINPRERERTLQSEKPTIKMVKEFKTDIESKLHKKYSEHRVRGEWFDLSNVQLKYICTNYN